VRELGQVIIGRFAARKHPEDITLFKSLGIAVEDVAVASRVYAKARAECIGKVVNDW
jgi:ornithine cyclodeaminase/alanine dehydrogenase-like protein (mu-crystallin family)